MTERDRLIELCDTNFGYVDEVEAEVFADYLIKNGVIALPCQAGDTVYAILRGKIEPLTVVAFIYTRFTSIVEVVNEWGCTFHLSDEGHIDWFLTKEEAEQKLKETSK